MKTERQCANKKTNAIKSCLVAGALFLSYWPPLLVQADETAQSTPMMLEWADLLPEGEKAALKAAQHKLIDIPPMPDLGAVLPEEPIAWLHKPSIGSSTAVGAHDNQQIELIGYPVPFSPEDNQTYEGLSFLLVPELGAGLYQPLPPPNQTVLINLPAQLANTQGKALPKPESPIKITGTLRRNSAPNTPYAYIIDANHWDW